MAENDVNMQQQLVRIFLFILFFLYCCWIGFGFCFDWFFLKFLLIWFFWNWVFGILFWLSFWKLGFWRIKRRRRGGWSTCSLCKWLQYMLCWRLQTSIFMLKTRLDRWSPVWRLLRGPLRVLLDLFMISFVKFLLRFSSLLIARWVFEFLYVARMIEIVQLQGGVCGLLCFWYEIWYAF